MKKAIFTIVALVALTLSSNAQDNSGRTAAKKDPATNTNVSVGNGTNSSANSTGVQKSTESKEGQPKTTGTRMAINEKGLPGNSKSNTSAKKEEKK